MMVDMKVDMKVANLDLTVVNLVVKMVVMLDWLVKKKVVMMV